MNPRRSTIAHVTYKEQPERVFGLPEGKLQRRFGRNLREYRKARDLSQEAFADVLGVHRTYMGGIERGERNLTLKAVERYADRLGVDPLSLLNRSTRERPTH